MRICSKCSYLGEDSEFAVNYSQCKPCRAEYKRKYRLANKEKIASYSREYYVANKHEIASKTGKYYQDNKEAIASKSKEYRSVNREDILAKKREYYEANKKKIAEGGRKYYQENKEKRNEYARDRRKIDPGYRLATRLRNRVNSAIKSSQKSGSAVNDLGCTIDELKHHLESQFQEGMYWGNWAHAGWHIDHIKPLRNFDLTDREQFLEACHYTNMQPLWALENYRKGAKL